MYGSSTAAIQTMHISWGTVFQSKFHQLSSLLSYLLVEKYLSFGKATLLENFACPFIYLTFAHMNCKIANSANDYPVEVGIDLDSFLGSHNHK